MFVSAGNLFESFQINVSKKATKETLIGVRRVKFIFVEEKLSFDLYIGMCHTRSATYSELLKLLSV